MGSMLRFLTYLIFFPTILITSIPAKGQSTGLHVHSGMIRVKMESENILPPAPNQSGIVKQATPLQTGIASFDALNRQYNVSSYLRVFPYAGDYEQKHRDYGLHLWYDLFIDEHADPVAVAEEYCTVSGVLAAEPIYRIAQKGFIDDLYANEPTEQAIVASLFNDPDFEKQWNFENEGSLKGAVADVDIDIIEAWNISTGSPNVIVCVVDDGVDFTHADLAANMWHNPNEIGGNGVDDDGNGYIDDIYGFNFVTKSGDIIPGDHGTLVAGVIAAVNNNGIGISSIAGGNGSGNGVKIMSAQTFREASSVSAGPAYVFAADNGAVIAQSSWGYSVPNSRNQSDVDAISYFIKEAGRDKDGNPRPNTPMVGGLVIFSAGNVGDNSLWYPAASENVIAVAAVGISGKKPTYSNYGSWVDISAPGGDAINSQPTIYGTTTNNGYGYNQGTSFACPHVSGVAALILSKYGHNGYTPDSLRVRLEATTTSLFDLEPDYAQYMGFGLLNAAKAMQPFVSATGITLPAIIDMEIGEVYTPKGFIEPSNATDQRIRWSGVNPDIASVDLRGRLMGLNVGTTQAQVSSYDGLYSKTCTIKVNTTTVKEIHISPNTLSLSIGETYQLETKIVPSNAANPTIEWSSSNSAVASIDGSGIITALSEGITAIIARSVDGNITDTCTVAVGPPVSGISVQPKNVTLAVGQKVTLQAEISPANAVHKEVTWTSSDSRYAAVDEDGVVTAIKAGRYGGTVNIKITVASQQGSFSDDATITIQSAATIPEGFSPNGDGINDYFSMPLTQGNTYTLRIFDKSGQPCYESTSYQNDWNGIANTGVQKGKKVLAGTYYYVLYGKNNGEVKKGYVVIKY